MCSDGKDLSPILKELFPSAEMASYLAECALTRMDLRNAVAYAAIPLARKRDLFLRLASGKDTAYFRRQAGAVEGPFGRCRQSPVNSFI